MGDLTIRNSLGFFGDIMNGISIFYGLFLDVETFNIAMENGLFLDVLPY